MPRAGLGSHAPLALIRSRFMQRLHSWSLSILVRLSVGMSLVTLTALAGRCKTA